MRTKGGDIRGEEVCLMIVNDYYGSVWMGYHSRLESQFSLGISNSVICTLQSWSVLRGIPVVGDLVSTLIWLAF
jgi:hypothetical protein